MRLWCYGITNFMEASAHRPMERGWANPQCPWLRKWRTPQTVVLTVQFSAVKTWQSVHLWLSFVLSSQSVLLWWKRKDRKAEKKRFPKFMCIKNDLLKSGVKKTFLIHAHELGVKYIYHSLIPPDNKYNLGVE